MNILNKLTKKNLSLNKKRTIVTIIGILLSTALIVCVSGMVTSFQKTLVNFKIEESGNYHVRIKNMTKEDLLALQNNRNVEDYFVTSDLGYAPFSSLNDYKPYVFIKAYDEKALKNYGLHLTEGRLPENGHEIIISSHLIHDGGFDKKIGDTITLDIGKRYVLNGEEKEFLNQNNPYLNADEDSSETEEFIATDEKTYTIVGVMDRPNYEIENYRSPGYTCITYLEQIDQEGDALVLYSNPKNYSKKTKEIVGDNYGYTYNSSLLRWLGVTESDTMFSLYIVAAIVIGIIIVSSVFVIKNSFAISITEKYKMYGMLRSVGATSKQIKKNVLFEGFILGIIAIPIGILCGILAIVILVFLINAILGDYLDGIHFVYSIPLFPILLSIVLAGFTIYFSTIFTAKKAGKISAIDAIRNSNEIKIKSKKLRTPKIIKKLFKTGGVIAYKNLKRNKKKYRTTVISIVVSVVIFLSLSSFIDFGFRLANLYYKEIHFNMVIVPGHDLDKKLQEEIETKITNLETIERISILKDSHFAIDTKKYLSDYGKKILESYGYDEDDSFITVVSVGKQEFDRYLKEIGLNNDSNQNKGILIDEYADTINKKKYVGNFYNIKNNTMLEGKAFGYDEDGEKVEKDVAIEVIRSNVRPMGLEQTYSIGGYLVVSDDVMKTSFEKFRNSEICVKASDTKAVEEYVENLEKENPNYGKIYVSNYEDEIKQNDAMILIISIFLYGFITVIILIGITNIFNTITTNMNLRSKEFAMLKSVGMTNKEFNRMIRLESIFYGTKALLFGIPIGLTGSYLIYLAFKEGLEFGYILPVKSLIIAVLFVALIIGIIMKYSLSKINKQNIIETIRNDNI